MRQAESRALVLIDRAEERFVDGQLALATFRFERADGRPALPWKTAILWDGRQTDVESAHRIVYDEHRRRFGALAADPKMFKEQSDGLIRLFALAQLDPKHLESVCGVDYSAEPGAVAIGDGRWWSTIAVAPPMLERLARCSEVLQLFPADTPPDDGGFLAPYMGDGPGDYTRALTNLGPSGKWSDGTAVGIVEGFGPANNSTRLCALTETHEAFTQTQIEYLGQPTTCTSDSDCVAQQTALCSGVSPGAAPLTDVVRCITRKNGSKACARGAGAHTHYVAARVTAYAAGQPRLASRARLVVSNAVPGSQLSVPSSLDQIYVDLAARQVSIVNQSYAAQTSFNPAAAVANAAAYDRRMLLVQAAGNNEPNSPTSCAALNSFCVGTTWSNGSYGNYLDDVLGSTSSGNPFAYGTTQTKVDAERPDVVVEAGGSFMADQSPPLANHFANMPTDYIRRAGVASSWAAPVASGVASILRSKCLSVVQFSPGPEDLRAMLKTGAVVKHTLLASTPSVPIYPPGGWAQTSLLGRDARAGVGILDAESLNVFCNPPGPPPGDCSNGCGGNVSTNLAEGTWAPIPSWALAQSEPPAEMGTITAGSFGSAPGALTPSASQEFQRIASLPTLVPGNRLRATLSFSTCPRRAFLQEQTLPTRDWDLVLVDVNTETLVAQSVSLSDTNEGFDVVIQGSPDVTFKTLELWAVRYSNGTGCQTVGGSDFDPSGLAWIYWR
jgi:hypothetical protein